MTSPSIVIGADIGGSHITAARVDLTNKQLITSSLVRLSVNSMATCTEVNCYAGRIVLNGPCSNNGLKRVCLAMPGLPSDYEAGICLISDQNKYPMLYGIECKRITCSLGIGSGY